MYLRPPMLTNAEIKRVRSLRDKKFRDAYGLFTVEGEKLVAEALDSDFEVLRVIRAQEAGEAVMSKISACASPSPVLAVVRIPEQTNLPEPAPELRLALDSVRDPGNLGTILRIADWFGVSCVYVSPDTVDTFNPKTVQASMGSVFRVRVYSTPIPALCEAYCAAGIPVYGTMLDGTDIYGTELSRPGLIVMGNESNGICEEVAEKLSVRLRIPPFGKSGAESLNVAAATAVTLSEFRRR